MKPVRFLAVSAIAGLFAVVSMASTAQPMPVGPASPSLGGAGAFIPPAHVNGVFGAGGPCAGVGGAGAFIPPIQPAASGLITAFWLVELPRQAFAQRP
jgi:hypothetical protein